jgi:hypothetical protein
LSFNILAQPDDTTCGPTCLQAIYAYYGDTVALTQLIGEIEQLENGGTLAVILGCHALKRGYRARIYTYKTNIFDPTWFRPDTREQLRDKLEAQLQFKSTDRKFERASLAYIEFLDLGGRILMEDLNPQLIRQYLRKNKPILTGLSATYLYQSAREIGDSNSADDLRGEPVGHFVVMCGFDRKSKQVLIADPYRANPYSADHFYSVRMERAICSILLGVVTFDGILLMIEPGPKRKDDA